MSLSFCEVYCKSMVLDWNVKTANFTILRNIVRLYSVNRWWFCVWRKANISKCFTCYTFVFFLIFRASQFTLNFGGITLDNFESGREQRFTTTAIVHPGYNSANLNNDIALIRIDNPIQFNNRIQPIPLPARGDVTGAGIILTVSGWGRTSDTSKY